MLGITVKSHACETLSKPQAAKSEVHFKGGGAFLSHKQRAHNRIIHRHDGPNQGVTSPRGAEGRAARCERHNELVPASSFSQPQVPFSRSHPHVNIYRKNNSSKAVGR